MNINILLKDSKQKKIQEFKFLSEKKELEIYKKIREIDPEGFRLACESLTDDDSVSDNWINKGYTLDNELYEKLILDNKSL